MAGEHCSVAGRRYQRDPLTVYYPPRPLPPSPPLYKKLTTRRYGRCRRSSVKYGLRVPNNDAGGEGRGAPAERGTSIEWFNGDF